MNYFIILITVLLFAIQTLSFKEFNRTYMRNLASYFIFNFLYYSIVVIIFLLPGGITGGMHMYTILLGTAFGILFIVTMLSYMKAMETGPLSYSTLFFSFGILVPVISGMLFWNEAINIFQIVGLALLLITFYLGSASSDSSKQHINLKWMFFSIAAFIGNGGLMTLAKQHQVLLPGREVKQFLIIAFGTAALLSLLLYLWNRYSKHQSPPPLGKLPLILIILASGITTAFGNQLTLYLASRIPAVIQFPLVNGGVVIFSTIFSSIFFKERINRKGILGLGLGIVSLFLLSMK